MEILIIFKKLDFTKLLYLLIFNPMFKFFQDFRSNDIDFKPYRQKENGFKRLATFNLVVSFVVAPIYCYFVEFSHVPSIYYYLALSYTLIFPIYIGICYLFQKLRDKLFYFFVFHLFGMSYFALIDLISNGFRIPDLFTFYCLYGICLIAIQRFVYTLAYVIFILVIYLLSFQFYASQDILNKTVIFLHLCVLGMTAVMTLFSNSNLIKSVFDFNYYLKKISQGDKLGFYLIQFDNQQLRVLDFDRDISRNLLNEDVVTHESVALFFQNLFSDEDKRGIFGMKDEHFYTKFVENNDKYFELIISPIEIKNRRYYFIKTNDVTTRMHEQNELIKSEEKYRNLYNESLAGVFTLNKQGVILNFNNTFHRMFESTFKVGDMFFDEDEIQDVINIVLIQKKLTNYQQHFRLKNDSLKWFVINFFFDDVNQLIEGTIVDVSEMQEATDALRKSEEKYKLIYEESNDAILLLENDLIIDINRRAAQIFGIPRQEMLNSNFWELSEGNLEDAQGKIKQFKHRLVSAGTTKFNWIFKGRKNAIEAEVAIIEMLVGKQIIHQVIIHDVTLKNNSIRALESSKEDLNTILDSTPEGFIILNGTDVLYSNKELHSMVGSSHIDISKLFVGGDQAKFFEMYQQRKQHGGKVSDQLLLNSAQDEIIVDTTLVKTTFGPLSDATLVIVKDISYEIKLSKEKVRAELAEETNKRLEKEIQDRIRTEMELENLLLKTQSIYDSSTNVFLSIIDVNGNLTYANDRTTLYFEKFLGVMYRPSVAVSTYFHGFFTEQQMDDFFHMFNKVLIGKSRQFVFSLSDGVKERWFEAFMNPIYDREGNIPEISLMFHDITIKKISEQETIQSLKEKEILLKEIHHRVKNNLQVISSILSLQTSFVTDDKTIEILQESRNRIRSMATIHEGLYRTTNFASIDFENYLKNLVLNLSSLYNNSNKTIEIIYNLQQVDISLDQAVPSGLIMNELITNSLKYAFINDNPEGNKLTITMREVDKVIFLQVTDNGVGFPDNYDIEQSDTLGLQLVTTLCDQLDARLEFKNDGGTDFLISFDKI